LTAKVKKKKVHMVFKYFNTGS